MHTAIRASTLSQIKKERLIHKIKKYGANPPWEAFPESIQFNICRAKLSRGCWDWLGWELRSDWSQAIHAGKGKIPLWDGRKCRLLVIGEEGVGDEIMAASTFSDLLRMNPDTQIECDARLVEIFSRSFPQGEFVPRKTSWEGREADMIVPMMDVLAILRKSPQSCPGAPYLIPDPERVQYWAHKLPYRVGVAWKSRHGRIKPPPVQGVSLQYGEEGDFYKPDLDPIRDFSDQINLIAALDMVISGPMSVVHAAGALGIETHVIMPPIGSGEVHNTLHWRYDCGLPFYRKSHVHNSWHEARKYARCHEFQPARLSGVRGAVSGDLPETLERPDYGVLGGRPSDTAQKAGFA